MKPTAIMDSKTEKSATEMAPVQIFQSGQSEKKGLTGKHVLIAVAVVLSVAIIVCGFVVGFYMMKQTSDKHSDNMTKVFHKRVSDGKTTVYQNVKTNVYDRTTEVDTKDDKGDDAAIYNDFKKSITVIVSQHCYVTPMNRTAEQDPATLQKYYEDHPDPNVDATNAPKDVTEMAPAEDPIEDTSFLGTKINKMCSGKSIYWMYPKQADDGDVTEAPARQKRATCYRCYVKKYCYVYYNKTLRQWRVRCIYLYKGTCCSSGCCARIYG